MHKKLLAIVVASAFALPVLGIGTAAADPGHTSCAQGAVTAVDDSLVPGGPGQGPSGAAVSAAAQDGTGASEEINTIKDGVCTP